MTPSQLPDGGQKPTAVILVDSEILEGEDAFCDASTLARNTNSF